MAKINVYSPRYNKLELFRNWTVKSLEEISSAQVAMNLCQDKGFLDIALRLDKPSSDGYFPFEIAPFMNDPEKLAIWAKMKKDKTSLDASSSRDFSNKKKIDIWNSAIDEKCQRLTDGIPQILRQGVQAWMYRIALEYLSYSRRLEILFGVSRFFLMRMFTKVVWKEAGRLDEKKLAHQLLEDERLTVLQRYRIACVYCLHTHIPQLWFRLTRKEKKLTSGSAACGLSVETHNLVLLWSRLMALEEEENVPWETRCLWSEVTLEAVSYGNQVALMQCWKMLQEHIRHQMVIDMAMLSLRRWQSMQEYGKKNYKERLVSKYFRTSGQSASSVKFFNLPIYYSELMRFFQSQMSEEQKLTFFKEAFQRPNCDSVLECFLSWPLQCDFLPTISKLWGLIPKNKYGQCLLTIASKYIGNDEEENSYYDYRNMLELLWEKTPEEYKQYVFQDKKPRLRVINEGKALLFRLLKKVPFQEKDEALFKQVFSDQPQEERKAMMHSKVGENICLILTRNEKWFFMHWLLEKCLSKEEIPIYKKQFIQSDCCLKFCLDKLEENQEKIVEDLIDWSLELDAEKLEFKNTLIRSNNCFSACKTFLHKGEFAKVDRVINFCLFSDEMKEQSKADFAQYTCRSLLKYWDYIWDQMDTILTWSVDTKEKIRDIKKDLFSHEGIDTHYDLVFVQKQWEEVERFYKWFDLSPEEIKKLKKDTLFTSKVIHRIHEDLPEYTNTTVACLRWCLIDEEMVINLKKEVEKQCFNKVLNEKENNKKEWLDYLMSELLFSFRKQVSDSESVFVKEKRSSVDIEDESSLPKKLCK